MANWRGLLCFGTLIVLSVSPPSRVSAQAPEYAFRLLRTISVGPLTLENLTVASVAVEGIDSRTESTDYAMTLVVETATVKLTTADGASAVELRNVKGSIRGTFKTAPGHPESIRSISAGTRGVSLTGRLAAAMTFPGALEGQTVEGAASLGNSNPLELGVSSSGRLLLTPALASAKSMAVALPHSPGGVPVRWTARSTRAPVLLFDSASRTVGVQSAQYALEIDRSADYRNWELAVGRQTIRPTAMPSIAARLSVEPQRATLAIERAVFSAPVVTVADSGALPPEVMAIDDATVVGFTAEYEIGRTGFDLKTVSAREVAVRPNREKVAELVNDGFRVPNQLVPTGDPTVPYAGSHALRGLYDGLVRASVQPERDHSILLLAEKQGIVSEAHYQSTPRDGASDDPPIICVAIGTGAGWAVSGLGLAAAVKTMLPIAFAAGLKGGTILTPAATPYVFAGVMAVGVPTLWGGTQFFANTAIEQGAGIPCGADLGDPKNLLGCALGKGVEKFCEMVVAFGAQGAPTREGWPAKASGQSTLEFMDMRRQMLKQQLQNWRPPRPGERPAWLSADPRPHQNAWLQNGGVWQGHNTQRFNELEQRHASQNDERRRQWLEQQNANAAASNQQQRIYADIVREDEARLRSAIGGGAGGSVRVTIPLGSGSPGSGSGTSGGGTGGGSSACPAGYECLRTTVPLPRRD